MRKVKLLFLFCALFIGATAQVKEVTGKVTDSRDGSPLVGVTVKAKGAANSTTTNSEGAFTLNVPNNTKALVISYVGFKVQETAIGNTSNISLSQAENSLSEVVVVGFGTKAKRDLTGSIAKVSSKDISGTPAISFESAIQGRAAGVFVEQQNGKLGQGIKVRVRGAASITAGGDPLYVVDGITLQNSSLSSNGAQTNPLADINPNDIESIEILKDASATAIYGANGSNGVVLITTKKGKVGKSKIEFGYFTGNQKPTGKRDFMNAQEYVDYFRMAAANAFRLDPSFNYVTFTEARLKRYSGGNDDYKTAKVNTDWQEEAFQKAPISQYDLNFSGGNEKTTFYMGGQYIDQKGIIVRNSLKRYSGRLNLEHKVRDWLSFGMNMSFVRSNNNRISNDNAFSTPLQIVALSPITPLIDPRTGLTSGALDLNTGRPNTNFPVYYNPLLGVENASYLTTVNRTLGNIFSNVKIAKGLNFRSEFGVDQTNQNEQTYNGKLTARNQGVPNGAGFAGSDEILNLTVNNFFQFNKSFNDKNVLDAVLGTSYQKYDINSISLSGEQFPSDVYKKLSAAAAPTSISSSGTAFRVLSYFGRVNYKFNDRYLLALSGRYDGSSKFGANNRYGFFPAASLGWIVTEERFLQNVRWLSFLKLKAGYGETGNSLGINNFASRGLYSANGYGALAGQRPTQLANADLKWETTGSLDVGFEASFLKNRISLEVDYYERKTRDLLLNVNIPGVSGFAIQTRNAGKLNNKGIEFTLNTENIVGKNFKWSTNLNFAANRNKIIDLAGQQVGTLNRAKEGEALGVFFAREFAGADPANGDALYYKNTLGADGKRDRSTTNNYNDAQDVVIGNPNPDFIYGIKNNFSYKGLDLDVLLQGVYGNEIFNGGGQYMSASGSNGFDNQTRDQLNSWKKPGDITQVPEARLFFANGTDNSSRYISDGSYLRVKAVTLGYNLPKSILSRVRLEKARIYVRGQNLFTITNYQGWDPEVNADFQASEINQGQDFYSAPQLRTVVFGINIGL